MPGVPEEAARPEVRPADLVARTTYSRLIEAPYDDRYGVVSVFTVTVTV